ncbi:RHS repeat domain-containing protein, partial [Aureicoccus marinus]
KWLFTKYDAFGRITYRGIKVSTSNRQTLQDGADAHGTTFEERGPALDKGGITIYYTDNTYPSIDLTGGGSDEILTVSYYDSYVDQDGLSIPASNRFSENITNATQGLATVSKTRVLDHDDWITTVNGYDQEGRVVYSASKNNYLNTTDISESNIDFTGKVLESKSSHTRASNAPVITNEYFTYDHMARPLTHQQAINANPWTTLSSLEYDKLGQNTVKYVGDSIQTVNYTYNIRGWLKSINDPNNLGNDLFAFQINYNDPQNFGAGENPQALFNGNISQTLWNSASVNNTGNPVSNRYSYTYDALNRIKTATDNTSNYNVSNITYDKMGNIETLSRNGFQDGTFANMDVLTYGYDSGNKLLSVNDTGHKDYGFIDKTNSSNEYTYDLNGNMITDSNKGITGITYNHLNLPTSVNINGGTINYVYDATGIKLKKTVSTGTSTDYAGIYIYEDENLSFFSHPEGYVDAQDNFLLVYQNRDHLGSNRLSFSDSDNNGTPEIVEENNYYPFGHKHQGYNSQSYPNGNNSALKFSYNGKEEQTELNLDWYDYGARNYDAAIGRWMNIDAAAQEAFDLTPFRYAANNPVYFVDPDGLFEFKFKVNDNGERRLYLEKSTDEKAPEQNLETLMKETGLSKSQLKRMLGGKKGLSSFLESNNGIAVTELKGRFGKIAQEAERVDALNYGSDLTEGGNCMSCSHSLASTRKVQTKDADPLGFFPGLPNFDFKTILKNEYKNIENGKERTGDIVRYANNSDIRVTTHTATLLLTNSTKGRQVFYKKDGSSSGTYNINFESTMLSKNPGYGKTQGAPGDKSAFYRYVPPSEPNEEKE